MHCCVKTIYITHQQSRNDIPMKQDNSTTYNSGTGLRYWMFLPLSLMIASVISCSLSYSHAKQDLANDLNDAIFALANENSDLWTRPDTVAAIRQMYETTHKPLIYQASDINFRNSFLKDEAYFTLAPADKKNITFKPKGNKIASDSIMLIPERTADGLAIQIQGFADCSVASVFIASDQTFPVILFSLSILSMASMFIRERKGSRKSDSELIVRSVSPSLNGVKLTPMQRRFAQMLLDAPDMKVDKRTLCETLWDNKSNAEESLYTLVRRTKAALAKSDIKIICNRGDSYELHINN